MLARHEFSGLSLTRRRSRRHWPRCAPQKNQSVIMQPPSPACIRGASRRGSTLMQRDNPRAACDGVDLPELRLGEAPEFQVRERNADGRDCNGGRTREGFA